MLVTSQHYFLGNNALTDKNTDTGAEKPKSR